MPDKPVTTYNTPISDIGSLLTKGRKKNFQQVNTILVETYWNIGAGLWNTNSRETRKQITAAVF